MPPKEWGVWGGNDNDDNPGGDDDDNIEDVRPHPTHTTINLFDEEEGRERLPWTRIVKGGMAMPSTRRRPGQPQLQYKRSG